jgi:hypothetical protein
MPRRFSAQELRKLRNLIPIDFLIENILIIPSKFTEGYFRFLCPLCSEFNTATSHKTNLARCFRCQEQFNTIELVMACKQSTFVESVKFLQKYQDRFPPTQQNLQGLTDSSSTLIGNINHKPHNQHTYPLQTTSQQLSSSSHPINNACNDLEPLGDILKKSNLIPNPQILQKSPRNEHPKAQQHNIQTSTMIQHICELEQKFETLSKQLQNIKAQLSSM